MSMQFVVPAALATAAVLGAGFRRGRLRFLVIASAKPEHVVWFGLSGRFFLALSTGYLTAYGLAAATTATMATSSSLSLPRVAADLGLLWFATAAGLSVGGMLPQGVAPVVGAAAAYLVLGLATFSAPGLLSSATGIDARWQAFVGTESWLLLLKAVWLGLAGAAIISTIAAQPRRAVLLAWAAGATLSPLLFVGTADQTARAGATDLICGGDGRGDVDWCLPRVKSYLAQDLVAETRRVQSVLGPWGAGTLIIVDDEAADDDDIRSALSQRWDVLPKDAVVELTSSTCDISAVTLIGDEWRACRVLLRIAPQSQTADTVQAEASSGLTTPAEVLLTWAFQQLDLATDGSAFPGAPQVDGNLQMSASSRQALAWLRSLDDEERRIWWSTHAREIEQGTLPFSEFGP